MREEEVDATPENDPISGQAARRKFLKKSGSVAIAAPAAMLLLSMASKSAAADDIYTTLPPG